jgi:hypothetical protein
MMKNLISMKKKENFRANSRYRKTCSRCLLILGNVEKRNFKFSSLFSHLDPITGKSMAAKVLTYFHKVFSTLKEKEKILKAYEDANERIFYALTQNNEKNGICGKKRNEKIMQI